MFRRKTSSKKSFLTIDSSNRGSDIKKPDNTSLIVNESDTETGNLRRELTSLFPEDEDENLVATPRTSSVLKSLCQKSQSTPIHRPTQNDCGKDKENIRSQKPRSSSNSQRSSYFEEVLKDCGAIPLFGNSSFELSQDQALFSINVGNKLKESPENIEKFLNSLKEKLEKQEYLQKMLAHTLTAENCEAARGPIQEPLMRILLNVDCLQAELIEILLKILADVVMDDKRTESVKVQLVSSMLKQLSFLCGLGDNKIGSRLFEIIHVASTNIKREIIFLLPEIIHGKEAEEASIELMDLLKFDETLSQVIIDTMANLPLCDIVRTKLCSKIMARLDKCPMEFLPSFVHFVLTKSQNNEYNELITGLRNNLPFTPQLNEIRKSGNRSKSNSEEDSFMKLTFENLKFSLMASRELTDTWIKVIDDLGSSTDFRCVDLIMLMIFYSCLSRKKSQILLTIQDKIKSDVLTHTHIENMFKILTTVAQEHSSSILEMASILLKSLDGKISNIGACFYKGCFIHFHLHMKSVVISEVLFHVGTEPSSTLTALMILKDLSQTEKKNLSLHTATIMGHLIKVQYLELSHARLFMDFISDLVCFESGGSGSAAEEELQIFIRKLLASPNVDYSKRGVCAAIMFGKNLLKESYGEEDDYAQVNSLFESAMGSNGIPEKRGFFNDEFATMARQSKSCKTFLKIWSEKTFNLVRRNLFVKDVEVESSDFPMSLHYSLAEEDVKNLVFPIVEIVNKSHDGILLDVPISTIPSTLRLLWCLEGNSEKILPVFCASIIMPETSVYVGFNTYDDLQRKKIMDCLFLCANYLIECVNALCVHGQIDKAAMRIKHLVSVRQLIAKFISEVACYVPPFCQFYAPTQRITVKKKTGLKKGPKGAKGRKRKHSKDAPDDSSDSVLGTQPATNMSVVQPEENIPPAEKPPQEIDLQPYFAFFRELDCIAFKMLLGKSSKKSKTTANPDLDTCEILFLLEDLTCKSEEILKSVAVPFKLKTKPKALLIEKMAPEDFVVMSLKILPLLLKKIESFSKSCEDLLEANDWIYDSHGLNIEGANRVKLAMTAGLKFITEIISWRGFQNPNCKLFTDLLMILTKKDNTERRNVSMEYSRGLAGEAANNLMSFSRTVMMLSGASSIVKSVIVCLRHSSKETSTELANICHEFLTRNWTTVTGTPEKGSTFNQQMESLFKTYFIFVENPFEKVRSTAKLALAEVVGLSGKNTMKTFTTINRTNFPVLYRTISEALVQTSTKKLQNAGNESDAQLKIWSEIVEIWMMLVEISKSIPARAVLASLLKRSRSLIQLFITKGIPIATTALRLKTDEVLKLLKSVQIVTRYLHCVCCHATKIKDFTLAAHVPAIRSLSERITLEVRGMLVYNRIPLSCMTIGILKNRDIDGNDIISQETLEENSEDDSEFPPEDSPVGEDNADENDEDELHPSTSKSY